MDRFREGQKGVDDDTGESRSSTSRVDKNVQSGHNLVMSDRCITTRMIAAELGISRCSVFKQFKEKLNS